MRFIHKTYIYTSKIAYFSKLEKKACSPKITTLLVNQRKPCYFVHISVLVGFHLPSDALNVLHVNVSPVMSSLLPAVHCSQPGTHDNHLVSVCWLP